MAECQVTNGLVWLVADAIRLHVRTVPEHCNFLLARALVITFLCIDGDIVFELPLWL